MASMLDVATGCCSARRKPLAYDIDLGARTVPVRTASAAAQRWFDRGWVWASAYHREEAAFCFAKAVEADAKCAMAHWGVISGPRWNTHAEPLQSL